MKGREGTDKRVPTPVLEAVAPLYTGFECELLPLVKESNLQTGIRSYIYRLSDVCHSHKEDDHDRNILDTSPGESDPFFRVFFLYFMCKSRLFASFFQWVFSAGSFNRKIILVFTKIFK